MVLHFQKLVGGVLVVLSEVDVGDGIDHFKMIVRHLERSEDMMVRFFLVKVRVDDIAAGPLDVLVILDF